MPKTIRFYYRYRDSGNYKKFGHKDFSNPDNLTLDFIKQELARLLIDGLFFYPEKVNIPKFKFHRYWDDYSWYEMENIEVIDKKPPKETINEFLENMKNNC